MPTLAPSVVDSLQTDSPSKPLKKVGFVSLGCPKNLVDSEVMMGILNSAGAEITVRAEEADIIVVNTCSFIDSAKQESVNTILEMARHKIDGRAQKLVVAGCLVERYRDEIRKNIPEVDAVVGTGFPHDRSDLEEPMRRVAALLRACRDIRRTGSPALDICWVGAGGVVAKDVN